MLTRPIVIWGAGAMGGTIGAYLVRAGHAVRFVDIVPEHVAAMLDTGLHVTGPVDDFRVTVDAVLAEDLTDPVGTVLLCVKAHHTANAVRMIEPRLKPDGVVVSVQNGLNEPVIAATLGSARTFGCFVNFGADYTGPGTIHHGGRGTVAVGEVDGRLSSRGRALHELFQAFDQRAILTDNISGYLWSKLAYASMLFATALSEEGIADALDRTEHRALYAALASEVVVIARALGIRLEPFDGFDPYAWAAPGSEPNASQARAHDGIPALTAAASASLDALVAHNRQSAKVHSGIWRDLAIRRRPTEVDAQLGAAVEVGARHGIAAPLNQRLIEMIHEVERGQRGQTVSNLDELAATDRDASTEPPAGTSGAAKTAGSERGRAH